MPSISASLRSGIRSSFSIFGRPWLKTISADKSSASHITIADLPNEILVQIFLFTTEPTNGIVDKIDHALISKTPICSPKTMASPFPLSQVCQLWRQIILDTKAMWRSIALSNPTIRHVHRVELWMERVKNHTIDILIHLNYPHTFPSEHHDAIVQIFEFLGRRATTWRSLEFGTSHFIPPPLITSLRGLSTANSSCLRRVTVSTPLLERPVDELWAFLHNIQSIEMLWWRGPHVYRATRSSSSRLQFLELSGISKAIMPSIPTFLVNTLSPFANIEELFINFQFEPPLPTSSQDELPRPIVFRKLRRLTIGAEIWLKDFAERFTAPALQYLNVSSGDTLYVDNFLRRSRCVLTEFIMHSVPAYRFGDLFDLSVLQSVTSLALYGKNSLDLNHLVKLLHCPPQASTRLHDKNYPSIPYFPNLQHLTLNGTVDANKTFDERSMLLMLDGRFRMIPLRRSQVAKLLKLDLSVPRITDLLWRYLKAMKGKGRVTLRTTTDSACSDDML